MAETRAPRTDDDLTLLRNGDLEILGLLPRASNYTFLARVSNGDQRTLAVYKPQAGEIPLWDFPDGTLCRREVAAYIVADELGWPSVPPTLLRDGPEGPGSVQLYVDFDPSEHYFTLREQRTDDFRRVALFDAVVNNADRKGGHCLLARDGGVFLIDHGVCFHHLPKLRTVIWDFQGDEIPAPLLADLERLGASVESGPLRERLADLLKSREIDAVESRLDALVAGGRFPVPGPGRPYPWPAL
jgi:uncharacterized repeat protein (TIGR03843 family)